MSTIEPTPEPEDDDNHGLPKDVDEEKLRTLVEAFANDTRKIGLYNMGFGFNPDSDEDREEGEPSRHTLVMQFQVGDIAFAPRTQDPEVEKTNDEFRRIAMGTVDDDIEAIRRKYLKSDEEEDEG